MNDMVWTVVSVDSHTSDLLFAACFKYKADAIAYAVDDYVEMRDEDTANGKVYPDTLHDLTVALSDYYEYPHPYNDVIYYITQCPIK